MNYQMNWISRRGRGEKYLRRRGLHHSDKFSCSHLIVVLWNENILREKRLTRKNKTNILDSYNKPI